MSHGHRHDTRHESNATDFFGGGRDAHPEPHARDGRGGARLGEEVAPRRNPAPATIGPALERRTKTSPRGAFSRLVPALAALPDAVAWTTDGHLALIEGKTGAAHQIAGAAGHRGARDLAFDPWGRRVVVFEAGGPCGGELATYPLVRGPRGSLLGARLHRAWIAGEARVLPAPFGIVAFEEAAGGDDRWAVFPDEGDDEPAWAQAPPPSSAWLSVSASGHTLHALDLAPDGSLHRRVAALGPGSLSAPRDLPLPAASAGPVTSARLLRAPARADAILFDQTRDAIALRLIQGSDAGPPSFLSFGARWSAPAALEARPGLRVEHAIALDGGELVVLLVSGNSHAIAVAIGPTCAILGCDALPLPGLVRHGTTALSHDLCALGHGRVLAATSAGVFALVVSRAGSGVQLAMDAGFSGLGLRGPIASLSSEMP